MMISSQAYIINAENGCNRLASELFLKFSATKMKLAIASLASRTYWNILGFITDSFKELRLPMESPEAAIYDSL